ncbi:MAG: hypothetical protein ACP5NI_08420 [Acetobacteraceae bacterium]
MSRRHLSPPLGLLHMPKAAGTGLSRAVEAWLRPRCVARGMDASQLGDLGDPARLSPGLRAMYHLPPAGPPAEADLFAGHFALSTLLARDPAIRLFTMLRAAGARTLSHWFYLRSYDDARLARFGEWGPFLALARRPLGEFLGLPALACQTDNVMARLLLWPDPRIPAGGFIAEADVPALTAAALERLSRFGFAGVIEDREAEARLFAWLGATVGRSPWSRLPGLRSAAGRAPRNEAAPPAGGVARPMAEEMADAAALLIARNRIDQVLWRAVAGRCMPAAALDRIEAESLARAAARYDRLLGFASAAAAR